MVVTVKEIAFSVDIVPSLPSLDSTSQSLKGKLSKGNSHGRKIIDVDNPGKSRRKPVTRKPGPPSPRISGRTRPRRRKKEHTFVPGAPQQPLWKIKPEPPPPRRTKTTRTQYPIRYNTRSFQVRNSAKAEVEEHDKRSSQHLRWQQQLASSQAAIAKVTEEESKLEDFQQVGSECATSRLALLTKQTAPIYKKEQHGKTLEWMGKRNLGEGHLHSDEIEILKCWFQSLDMKNSGTITFEDMVDPLFQTKHHKINNCEAVVKLLKKVQWHQYQLELHIKNDRAMQAAKQRVAGMQQPSPSPKAKASKSPKASPTSADSNNEVADADVEDRKIKNEIHKSDMTFDEFIKLCKWAMHEDSSEIKQLIAQLRKLLGKADGDAQLPADLTISMARRKFLVDSFFADANYTDKSERLKLRRDSAARRKDSATRRKLESDIAAISGIRRRVKRRSVMVQRIAMKEIAVHLSNEDVLREKMVLDCLKKKNKIAATVITKLKRRHWDTKENIARRKKQQAAEREAMKASANS